MKVGIISDTHNPNVGAEPPPEVATAFQGVDVILHAGDMHVIDVLDWLEESAVRKLNIDTPYGMSDSFPRTSDLLREAYTKGRGKTAAKGN